MIRVKGETVYIANSTKATSVLKQEMLNDKHCILFSSTHQNVKKHVRMPETAVRKVSANIVHNCIDASIDFRPIQQ